MTSDRRQAVLQSALDSMGVASDSIGPRPLLRALLSAFKNRGIDASDEDSHRLSEALLGDDHNDLLYLKWGETLRQWDHLEAGDWTAGTIRHTRERRDLIYLKLSMNAEWVQNCEAHHPPRLGAFESVPVIGAPWTRWYLPSRRERRAFYWPRYRRYLLETRGWPADSVDDLDRDSTAVVERLADAESSAAVTVRGLVVGYVQSGKTANFTAVIAKASDAGYRLIIVLAGTLDVLRNQTQRRVDKELIGKEIIEHRPNDDGLHDYAGDAEWGDFVTHGGLPGVIGGFDWQRLTTAKFDYRSLKAGIDALEFKQSIPGRAYNDPENLHRDRARLLVIKKAPAILKKVIKDLKRLRTALATVPTLIIDDESDLASVNTLPQREDSGAERRRTATNASIMELLTLLPRASYVGYTATPAATVLMDDQDELFPKDFIIPLPKPNDYMGVSEFIDPDDCAEEDRYREVAYVRHVEGEDTLEANLPKAVDAFVLSGCIKLHREHAHNLEFRHHTMLVHRSHQMKEHTKDQELVLGLIDPSRYLNPKGIKRLVSFLKDDFTTVLKRLQAVEMDRELPETATLPSEAEIEGLVGEFFDRLHRERVLVANGDPRNETLAPDFDKGGIWAILVGGTKLSRGYTVEGLTVSYYRRRVAAADTLMQMGRWFGYRRHYQDLVRVYLGREERKNQRPLDLHEEFRACCLDEEEFRAELSKYALSDGPPLRPQDIPPLVYNSGLLAPTNRNKMRFARRALVNFGGDHKERTLAPVDTVSIRQNWDNFEALCDSAHLKSRDLSLLLPEGLIAFGAICGMAKQEEVMGFLRSYKWSREGTYQDVLEFLAGTQGDTEIDDWCVLIPQLKSRPKHLGKRLGSFTLDVQIRARIGDERHRYKVFSDPGHAKVAKWIAGGIEFGDANEELRTLRHKKRAVLAAYPCRSEDEDDINLGFFTCFPGNRLGWKVTFVTNQRLR